jgi:hypothetical protein
MGEGLDLVSLKQLARLRPALPQSGTHHHRLKPIECRVYAPKCAGNADNACSQWGAISTRRDVTTLLTMHAGVGSTKPSATGGGQNLDPRRLASPST